MRLLYAFLLPWKLLFDAVFAARVRQLWAGASTKPHELAVGHKQPQDGMLVPSSLDTTSALQILAILQREGRLIDFLQEDIGNFTDAQIGAAARVVHEGCKRGLDKYLSLTAIRSESEGAEVVLPEGFDPMRTRITGNVVGQPPFRGRLAHHGWQIAKIDLPKLSENYDPRIVAPAEVEL